VRAQGQILAGLGVNSLENLQLNFPNEAAVTSFFPKVGNAPSSPDALLYASSFPPIQALSVESTLWLRDISLPATRHGLVSAWCGFRAGASAASAVRYLPEKTMGGVVVKGDPFPVKREKSRFPIIFLLFRQANHQLALRKVGNSPSAADIFESCSPQALISPRPRVLCGCFGESFRCPWR
jgi:hypothetical protein